MIHVLDVAEVREESLDSYLRILVDEYLPGVRRRGVRVERFWRTPPEAGPPSVAVLLAVDGWEDWARARSLASRDPAAGECARRLRELCVQTSRRFLVAVDGVAAP